MKTAIAFLSKDRCELSRQSIRPLLASGCDVWWIDGSETEEGCWLAEQSGAKQIFTNITGGAGAAIVFALTRMLESEENYTHVGLCENDVFLKPAWFAACGDLFDRGAADGLAVGAVSARTFEDRILVQRDGYAVMHNLGAGHILLTRQAAEIVLRTFRTAWTTDNRRIFHRLSGIGIGPYWAFRTGEHYLTADWHWDAALAAHGLASLASVASMAEMIGQNPPLAEQGLTMAAGPVAARRDDSAFSLFATRTAEIRDSTSSLNIETQFHFMPESGTWTIFPHQIHMLGGRYEGDWRLREVRGFGTFGWEAHQEGFGGMRGAHDPQPRAYIPLTGPCTIFVGGGKNGGKVEIADARSGFQVTPELPPNPQVLQVSVPGAYETRIVRVTALTPGVTFFGVQVREPPIRQPQASFDYSRLP